MKLGFIGTGEITKAVVEGILISKIKFNKIFLSKRNKLISSYLNNKSKKINILSSNQEIVNNSDWIFLAITPTVGKKIIKEINFPKNKIIISFISTLKLVELKKILKVKKNIIRAIPLPPISIMKGPIPLYPPNKKVAKFFNKIGECIELNNEKISLNFWAMSSMMAPYYEILLTTSKWLQKKGMDKKSSQKYITSLFLALSNAASLYSKKDLKVLVKNSQTPKGLNEQNLKFLKNSGFYNKLNKSLDKIYKILD